MVGISKRAFARSLVVTLAVWATLVGVSVAPAAAEVVSVAGGAFGYYTNVGLFGGPQNLRGHGQAADAPATAASPSVTLPPGGSAVPLSANDPDGAKAQYGPAVIFGGIWPENVASPPPSGPISVTTQGTSEGGSVTSTAAIVLNPLPVPVACAVGSPPPCTAPGGIGPGPLIADEARSTCTASESGVTGSATFVNGILETKYDSGTQLPILTEPIPANPPPNYTRSGTIDHVGDRFTVVFNEQIIGPDSITVNAAHMYLLGDIARGDMVVGSSTCSFSSDIANGTPVAADDSYSTAQDTPLTVGGSGLLGNDIDPNDHPLTAARAQAVFVPGPNHPTQSTGNTYLFPSDPPNGTATVNDDGSFTYQPDPGFAGIDTFTYVARDARGAHDSGRVTIDVTRPIASVGGVSVAEGDTGTRTAVFSVSLSNPSGSTVAVDYSTADVTAVAPGDYTPRSGTLSFAPGTTNLTITVPLAGDTADEDDESFSVQLSAPTNGVVIGDGTGAGTIVDDDPRSVTGRRLTIGDVSVHEGDDGARAAIFTVSLSKSSTSYVKVSYASANATATKGLDYTRVSGTLTFAPGATSMKIKVPVASDELAEGNETFFVNLSAASGATITDASGVGTVVDDD